MKAVIPAAGLGVRFLPYTKAQPKEMLPVVDKPAIQYVVEEAVASGIHDILIVTGRGKRAIEDHFDRHPELEAHLRTKERLDALRQLEDLLREARIHYVRQGEPLGLGHAVLTARSYVGEEPFAVLLGDDVTRDETPCTQQLLDIHRETHASVIAVQRVPREAMRHYGMVVAEPTDGRLRVTDVLEKPSPDQVTSDLAILGRYVLTAGIFEELRGLTPGVGGEIQLSDGLRALAAKEAVYAHEFRGRRYDLGSRAGWILANVELGLEDEGLGDDLRAGLRALLGLPSITAQEPLNNEPS